MNLGAMLMDGVEKVAAAPEPASPTSPAKVRSPTKKKKPEEKPKRNNYALTSMMNIPPVTQQSPKTKFKQMNSVMLILSEDDETKKIKKKVNKDTESANKELVSAEGDLRKVSASMEAKHVTLDEIRATFLKLGGGNGHLNQTQFREALVSRGLVDEAIAGRLFLALDTDHSGFLDFREFMMGVAHYQLGSDVEFSKKLEYLFKVYDLNGDGGISKMEFFKIFKLGITVPYDHKYMIEVVSLIFQECAQNTPSGKAFKVTLEDFVAGSERVPKIREFAETYLTGFDIMAVANGLNGDKTD